MHDSSIGKAGRGDRFRYRNGLAGVRTGNVSPALSSSPAPPSLAGLPICRIDGPPCGEGANRSADPGRKAPSTGRPADCCRLLPTCRTGWCCPALQTIQRARRRRLQQAPIIAMPVDRALGRWPDRPLRGGRYACDIDLPARTEYHQSRFCRRTAGPAVRHHLDAGSRRRNLHRGAVRSGRRVHWSSRQPLRRLTFHTLHPATGYIRSGMRPGFRSKHGFVSDTGPADPFIRRFTDLSEATLRFII